MSGNLSYFFKDDGKHVRQYTPIIFENHHEKKGFIKAFRVSKPRKYDDPDQLKSFWLCFTSDPETAPSCPLFRILDSRHFLQVFFYKDCPEKIIKLLIEHGLDTCVKPSGQRFLYKFFGHSPSQLRNKACVLFNSNVYSSHDEIVSRFGTFSSNNVAKRAARIGLLLSESEIVLQLQNNQVSVIEDVIHDKFTFTDGCGFIHESLAQKIVEWLRDRDRGRRYDLPLLSVYQIRFQGCKGVLMLTKEERFRDRIAIRPSMKKFEWKLPVPYPLGICENGKAVSFPNRFGSLNKQFIRLLSGLGVPDAVFLEKQEKFFKDLESIGTDPNIQVRFLCANEHFYEAESILYSDKTDEAAWKKLTNIIQKYCIIPGKGASRTRENFGSQRAEFREQKKKDFGRLHIPLEKSRIVYGVADPSGKLEYGTCFFKPMIRREKPTAFDGQQVIVARSPAYHPGDIRVLKCVNVVECDHLVDCIVFPTNGPRPHPDELSGGDLDGDLFFVYWDETLLETLKPVPPTSYQGMPEEVQRRVEHSDLVKYFVEYDASVPRRLEELYSAWANAKGVTCKECKYIANMFNIAIDSPKTGKDLEIPIGPPPTNTKKKTFVWEKLIKRAEDFKLDNCLLSSVRRATDRNNIVHQLNDDDISNLLELEDGRIPEYNLFRLIYKWREHRDGQGDGQPTQQRNIFKELMMKIDFSRLTEIQRKLALVDLQPLGPDFGRLVMNALYRSVILDDFDVAQLQKGFEMKEYNWVHYCRVEGSQISWKVVNDAMQMPNLKLIVLQFEDAEKRDLVLAIGILGRLMLHGTVNVNSESVASAIYMSDHHEINECALSAFMPLGKDYVVALDGERFQMYSERLQERGDTFVCLKNSREDGSVELSVAIEKFKRHGGPFYAKHQRTRVKAKRLKLVEIFINSPKPMTAPAIQINASLNQMSFAESAVPQATVPTTRRAPKSINSAELEERCAWLDEKIQHGESVIGDLKEWLREIIFMPEHQQEAVLLEVFLFKCRQHEASLLTAEEFHQLLKLLLQTSTPISKIQRLLETMGEVKECFSWKQFMDVVNNLVFCCEDRKLSQEFLTCITTSGGFPLICSEFYSLKAMQYFLHWLPVITVEFLHEVIEKEKNAMEEFTGWPFPHVSEKKNNRIVRKIQLNINGSHQPFSREDGLLFYLDPPDQPRLIFFAEIAEVEGMTIGVRIVWPEHSEAIDLLQALSNSNQPEENCFRVRAFPNLVTYKVEVETLKTVCIKNYLEPKPSRIVREIVESFSEYLLKVPVSQTKDRRQQLRSALQSSVIKDENRVADERPSPDQAPDLETDDVSSDLETDEPEPERPLHEIGAARLRSRKSVAFDLNQITYNIPGRANLPPRLQQQERRRRALSSHQNREIDLPEFLNRSQRSAVKSAVEQSLTVIQGPPGTGKTRVAAVIVQEWLKRDKHAKILVTACSNQATANLYHRLLDVGVPPASIQYMARSSDLPLDLQGNSHRSKYRLRATRSQRQTHDSWLADSIVEESRVVCATCTGSGLTLLKNSRFKYALVDEAAQATESLTLVPLCTGAEVVCLIGDDKQLTPIVNSKSPGALKMSLFERLRESGVPVHMLTIQYRMHPFIASFPSKQFYENRLEHGVGQESRIQRCTDVWPHPDKPVVFYDVEGYEKGETNSLINRIEAEKVVEIVNQLTKTKRVDIDDIGIISPYRAQVNLITSLFRGCPVPSGLVRTVDGFQGQERGVIIVSTVRANKIEGQRPIGFLSEPNRINVLLTRARCGLVVVGNRSTLIRDELWKAWLEFVEENGLHVRDVRQGQSSRNDQGQGPDGTPAASRGQGANRRPGGNRGQGANRRQGDSRGQGANQGQGTNRGQWDSRGQGAAQWRGTNTYQQRGANHGEWTNQGEGFQGQRTRPEGRGDNRERGRQRRMYEGRRPFRGHPSY